MTETVTWSDTVYMRVIGLFVDNKFDPGVMKQSYKNKTIISIDNEYKNLEYNFVGNDINAEWRLPGLFTILFLDSLPVRKSSCFPDISF